MEIPLGLCDFFFCFLNSPNSMWSYYFGKIRFFWPWLPSDIKFLFAEIRNLYFLVVLYIKLIYFYFLIMFQVSASLCCLWSFLEDVKTSPDKYKWILGKTILYVAVKKKEKKNFLCFSKIFKTWKLSIFPKWKIIRCHREFFQRSSHSDVTIFQNSRYIHIL